MILGLGRTGRRDQFDRNRIHTPLLGRFPRAPNHGNSRVTAPHRAALMLEASEICHTLPRSIELWNPTLVARKKDDVGKGVRSNGWLLYVRFR